MSSRWFYWKNGQPDVLNRLAHLLFGGNIQVEIKVTIFDFSSEMSFNGVLEQYTCFIHENIPFFIMMSMLFVFNNLEMHVSLFSLSFDQFHWFLLETIFRFFSINLFEIYRFSLRPCHSLIVTKSIVVVDWMKCLCTDGVCVFFLAFDACVTLFRFTIVTGDAPKTKSPAKLFYNILWGVHYMHICTQINNGNNDPIKVFMTFICDDEMENKN